MHINCSRDDLVYGVQVVSRAISTKNTQPILAGIMLKAEGNSLIFRATDLEMAIECSVPGEIIEEGTLVLPGRYFTEMVKRLPAGLINMQSHNNSVLEVRYEQSELSINGYATDEFPSLPEIEGTVQGSIDQDLFKKIIKQIAVAASTDETRPVFTGILMEVFQDQVIMVASDTHRLALRQGTWKGGSVEEKIAVIIPARTMVEVARIIDDKPEPLFISLGNNQVNFRAGNISLISRIIEGQYPNYHQVIPDPSKCKSKIRVRTKKLLEAADRASLLVREEIKERYSLIMIKVHDDILALNSNAPEMGKIYEEIGVYLEGEPTEIVFNSRYLIDALKAADAEEIYMELTGALSPGIIKTVDSEEYIYLILPVRTS